MSMSVRLLAVISLLATDCLPSVPEAAAACRVLVVTGLAGDAEQVERQVAELDDWRKIFAASGVAESDLTVIRSPHVAAEAAEAGQPPVRRQVLDHLASWKKKVGAADDLCLVLIGRGASFGKERFFQIRGQRLSAREVAAALDEILARSQTIFLTGPGTAGFARTLAGDTRVVVSATSDDREVNATQFGAAWCRAALASPQGTVLEWLAEAEAGVKKHYADRGALRTEHALLLIGRRGEAESPFKVDLTDEQRAAWTLARPFVPVVGADVARALMAESRSRPPAVADMRPAPPRPLAETETTAAAEPPSRHSYITSRPAAAEERALLAAAPGQAAYPDQPGVILLKAVELVVKENLSLTQTGRLQVAVFDPPGTRDLIDRAVAVPAGGQGKITVLKTILPTGEVLEVDLEWLAGLTREPDDESKKNDKPRSVPTFAPGVVPGAVVECGYEISAPPPPFPSLFDETPLAEPLPIKTLSLRLATPAAKALRHAFLDGDALPGLDPAAFEADRQNPFTDARTWTWRDLPALTAEGGQPARGMPMPRLAVSGYRSWEEFAEWVRRLMRGADEVTADVERKARELTAGLQNDDEKIRALYGYVNGLRYIALEGGANAWRPRFADSVLLQQYGDCKDKANLLVTLLRAAGLEGHLALVRRAAPFAEEMPGCHFNHAIMAVERPEGLLWLDPTDEVCPFGMLPPGDPGQRALLFSGETAAFHSVPAYHPGYDHQTRCEAELELAADRRTAHGKVRLSFAGLQGYEWRTRLRHLPADEVRRELARQARAAWPGVQVEAVTWTPPRGLDEPLRAELTVTLPVADPATGAIRMPGVWLPLAAELDAWPRRTPQALNGGYPLAFRQVVTLRHPPDMAVAAAEHALPDEPTIRVRIGESVGPGFIRRTGELAIDTTVISPAALPACRRALDAWEAGVARPIVTNAKAPATQPLPSEDPR